MAEKNSLLVVNGIFNLILGMMLIFFPLQLMNALDLPNVETNFYVNVLGAVLFGIGIALFVESFFGHKGITGLGIGGAIVINFCGAVALILWLLLGNLELSLAGTIFLWGIALVVLAVMSVEIFTKSWKDCHG